jgi:hypothetical protein
VFAFGRTHSSGDLRAEAGGFQNILVRNRRGRARLHCSVESIKQLNQARVTALAIHRASAEGRRCPNDKLFGHPEGSEYLVDSRRARTDLALYGASDIIGVDSPIRSDYPHVTLNGSPFQRHDKTAGEMTLLDEGVYRSPFADVQCEQLRTPGTTQIEKMEQQVDGVRQDIEKLQI